jgi:autoinducer 2-degrading protein
MASSFSGPFALNAKLSVKPEHRDEFLKAVQYDGVQTVATEPGALQFVLGEDTETENTFYLHEQYQSKEGLDLHGTTEHYAKWTQFEESSDPWADGTKPLLEFYTTTHEARKVPIRAAFCLNVRLCIKPEVRDEFLKVIENNAKGSNQDEPLCLQYDWGESSTEANTFHFHEEYTGENAGKEGFEAHTKAPHFLAWEEFAGTDPFTSPPVVSFYKSILID